jgi:IS30 family transposase
MMYIELAKQFTMYTYNHVSLKIEERRMKIISLLAQSISESEVADELGIDQSTISRDIKALKEQSQQFVYDLAKPVSMY